MVPKWKRLLGAAAVLLLVGAGCQATQEASTTTEVTGEAEDDGQMDVDVETTLEADADAALDAMLQESEDDTELEAEEGTDADVVTNDAAEIEAYGNAYDKSQF